MNQMMNDRGLFICSKCLKDVPYFALFTDINGNECCSECYEKLDEMEECDNCGSLVQSGICEDYKGSSVCPDCLDILTDIDEAILMIKEAQKILNKYGFSVAEYI